MSKQKQWSSFNEHQQYKDAWREYLNEEMSSRMVKARVKDKPDCLPDGGTEECPCPDAQGEKEEELEWSDQSASIATEGITGLQSVNRGLKLNLDDAAIMREYQQFLRDQKIKITDQGKELDLSEGWEDELARQEKEAAGAIVHEEDRAPKLGKLEDLKKYPNLYKLITAALQSEQWREKMLGHFKKAGFADVEEFAAASVQQQPEKQPEEQPEEQPEKQPEEQPEVPAEEPSPDGSTAPGAAGAEERQPGMVVGDEKKGVVHAQKVHAHLKKVLGKSYNEKKVKLVLQALARVNKNPEIQFPEEIQEDMDMAAAAKMLKTSGIDETFITQVAVAMMKTAGLKVADFNKSGRSITGKPAAGAAADAGKAVKKGDTYEYTSGAGKKHVVRVVGDPGAVRPGEPVSRAPVAILNPATCNPAGGKHSVPLKSLTTPYDKCPVPGAAEQGAQAPPPEKEKGHDWAKLPGQMEEASDQDQNTLQEAQLKRWKKLAGIIKG